MRELDVDEGMAKCECTHLTMFTAGEGLLPEDPEEPVIPIQERDDDDDSEQEDDQTDGNFPIMVAYSGFLLICLIATIIIDVTKQNKDRIDEEDLQIYQGVMLYGPRSQTSDEDEPGSVSLTDRTPSSTAKISDAPSIPMVSIPIL